MTRGETDAMVIAAMEATRQRRSLIGASKAYATACKLFATATTPLERYQAYKQRWYWRTRLRMLQAVRAHRRSTYG